MSAGDSQTTHTSASVFVSRRRFIQGSMIAIGGAWAGVLVGRQLLPSGGEEARPVQLALAELPVGGMRLISYGGSPALVLRSPESIKAFSLVCTHLGCTVEWQPAKNEFHCPCHDGRFDQFGEAIAGPPVVPLEQIAVKVEGDQVVVGAL